MAPTIVPDTVTAVSPVSREASDYATPPAPTSISWPANCTALLEQGPSLNLTTLEGGNNGTNVTDAYTLCLQQRLASNSSNFMLSNGSSAFDMSDSFHHTTLASVNDEQLAAAPTGLSTPLGDWVELLSARQDLLRVCIQSTILIAIFLASVLANSFVFVVFCRKPTLLSNSYRFVLNLAVCNSLMTVLVMPFVLISTFARDWVLGSGSCEAIGMLAILLFVASILTLMLIAMDRYHAIMKPLHYHLTVISKRPALCIAGVWLVSLLIALPPLFGWNHYSYQPGKAMCTVTWRSADPASRAYSFSFVLLCFVVPYFVMLWVYICAFRTAQRTTARARRNSVTPEHAASSSTTASAIINSAMNGGIGNSGSSEMPGITQKMLLSRDRRRSSAASLIHNTTRRRSSSSITRALLSLHRDDWKAAKTSLIVMSAFTVCWLPFFILITMEAIIGPTLADYSAWQAVADNNNNAEDFADVPSGLVIPYWLEGGAICLALAGCALNPLVYVFRSEKIKFEIRRIFCPGSEIERNGGCSAGSQRERDKEAASTATAVSQFRQGSILSTSRRESPASFSILPTSLPALCSSSASLVGEGGDNSAVSQAARITGAAATMVVTFNEDAKHRDGVCL